MFFSIAVLTLHCGVFSSLEKVHYALYYAVRYHIEFCAVPVFFLLSTFLFVQKKQGYLKQIQYIFLLYILWRSIHFLIAQDISSINFQDLHIERLLRWIIGEESPTYFLLDLSLVLSAAFLIITLDKKYQFLKNTKCLLALNALSIFLMLGSHALFQIIGFTLGYNNPCLYIVYATLPFAFFLNYRGVKIEYLLLLLYIFFIFIDFFLQSIIFQPMHFKPRAYSYIVYFPYARISIALQAFLIIAFMKNIKKEPIYIIKVLSKYSLGIYLIHSLFIYFFNNLLPDLSNNKPTLFFMVLTSSYFSTHIFYTIKDKLGKSTHDS